MTNIFDPTANAQFAARDLEVVDAPGERFTAVRSPVTGKWFAYYPWVGESKLFNALPDANRVRLQELVETHTLAQAIKAKAESFRDQRKVVEPNTPLVVRHEESMTYAALARACDAGYTRDEVLAAYADLANADPLHEADQLSPTPLTVFGTLPTRRAAGGVVFDRQGRILLRKPTNEYGGYVWTFPKGGIDAGERPAMAALREVEEETGWRCRITSKLGDYKGTTGVNTFYTMAPVGRVSEPDFETEAVVWARPVHAANLLQKTRTNVGRERDMRILRDALAWFDRKHGTQLSSRVAWKMLKMFGVQPEDANESIDERATVRVSIPLTLR